VWLRVHWSCKAASCGKQDRFWEKDCWGSCDYPSECRWGGQYGVQQMVTPAQNLQVADLAKSVVADEKAPEDLGGTPKTSFEEILLGIPHCGGRGGGRYA